MIPKYKISIQRMSGGYDHFSLSLPREMVMVSAIMIDDHDGKGLYDFVNKVIEGKNTKVEYSNAKDEYWTNGYTAQVVEKDGKKMLKIFFHLTDDYEPYFIDPKEFKELLEIWIKEKEKFDQDPIQYKLNLIKKG